MNIIEKQFENKADAKEFWDGTAFDILDINFALADRGLRTEALQFSLNFAEPDLMEFYANFKFNFDLIKEILGIPSQYVSREVPFSPEMKEPSRDINSLEFSAERMQDRFEIFNIHFQEEVRKLVKKLEDETNELIKKGAIKKSNLPKVEPKFEFIEKTLKEIMKKTSK